MAGILVGVGVGPGDPELLTIKACRALKACDLLVLPAKTKEKCYAYQIAVQAVPQLAEKACLYMDFPMIKDQKALDAQMDQNTKEIISWLKKNKNIVFVTIGDPSIYATYHYIHRRVVAQGYEAKIISGIPSFLAVAARLGISLADRDQQIHVIPGSYDTEDAKDYPGTRIYMKAGKSLAHLKAGLQREVEGGKTLEVYAVANCGMENEKVMIGLDVLKEDAGYLTTVIVK